MSEFINIGGVSHDYTIRKVEKGGAKIKGQNEQQIGLFDSGVGGLTVLSEVMDIMPHEDVLYLGDTAHVPYGGRPASEIIDLNKKILDYFELQDVKMVIMACGTSSSVAFPVYKGKYSFPIVALINPGSYAAVKATRNHKIGLIATIGTVNSKAYQETIASIDPKAQVYAEACPLFVPLIEGGFIEAQETRKVAREYLKPLIKQGIDTLILGCTHYPHLSRIFREITGPSVAFVDPAESAALEAKNILARLNLLNEKGHKGSYSYVVTGNTTQFEELGSKLLGRPIVSTKQVKI